MEDADYQAVQLHTYRLAEDASDMDAWKRAARDTAPDGPNAGKIIQLVPGKGSAPNGDYVDCFAWSGLAGW